MLNRDLPLCIATGLIILALLFVVPKISQIVGGSLAERVLVAEGMANIATQPAAMGNCASGQTPVGFTATRADGTPVSGVVCENLILQTAYIKYR